jgi:hypothetical protein
MVRALSKNLNLFLIWLKHGYKNHINENKEAKNNQIQLLLLIQDLLDVCIADWDPINHHHISVHVLSQVTDLKILYTWSAAPKLVRP